MNSRKVKIKHNGNDSLIIKAHYKGRINDSFPLNVSSLFKRDPSNNDVLCYWPE